MKFHTIILVLLIAIIGGTFVFAEEYHCVHNRADFENNSWRDNRQVLGWAASSSELPGEFKDRLKGQYQDVFYFSYKTSIPAQTIGRTLLQESPAYIYLKYYAHAAGNTSRFHIDRDINSKSIYLLAGTGYAWNEVLVEIYPEYDVVIFAENLEQDNYLFMDTIIYTQGKQYDVTRDMEAVKSLCPKEGEITTVFPTTEILTDAPGTPYPPTQPPGSDPPTNPPTTTKAPTDPHFTCVDTLQDFGNDWLYYPFYEYAQDSLDLPRELKSLEGNGMFYMEGSSSFEKMFFFKNFHGEPDWGTVPTYLYLKYYAHTESNNSQIVYARPAHIVPDDHIQILPPGTGFKWEIIVQIQSASVEQIIEFGTKNFQVGDTFLIDKIAVARSNDYSEVLTFILNCVKK